MSIDDTIDFIINTTNQSRLAIQKACFALINDMTIATTTIDESLEEMNISEDKLKKIRIYSNLESQ